tara:strand:+ start:2592 stop:2906 length:315 start_codon:yes stop_codon:yes gene_type:complete
MGLTTGEGFAKISAQNSTDLNNIIATGGFKMLTGVGAHTALTGYAIVPNTDTVFTVFEVDGVEKLSDYGLSGVTVKAGAYLPVPKGAQITAVTMASGDCLLYNL